MKADRDYSNLKETAHVYDAVKRQSTQVKDYSLRHIVTVIWRANPIFIRRRLVIVRIGVEETVISGLDIFTAVNEMVDEADEDGVLPPGYMELESPFNHPKLLIDTRGVNFEALRDHVAEVTIGNTTALIDLEEFLKAVRYS